MLSPLSLGRPSPRTAKGLAATRRSRIPSERGSLRALFQAPLRRREAACRLCPGAALRSSEGRSPNPSPRRALTRRWPPRVGSLARPPAGISARRLLPAGEPMSTCQALDRPLTPAQQEALRGISSRARVTPRVAFRLSDGAPRRPGAPRVGRLGEGRGPHRGEERPRLRRRGGAAQRSPRAGPAARRRRGLHGEAPGAAGALQRPPRAEPAAGASRPGRVSDRRRRGLLGGINGCGRSHRGAGHFAEAAWGLSPS